MSIVDAQKIRMTSAERERKTAARARWLLDTTSLLRDVSAARRYCGPTSQRLKTTGVDVRSPIVASP